MKYIFLILFAFLSCNVYSQEWNLTIITKAGTRISLPVVEQPKITFQEGIMTIATEQLQVSNISKYVFDGGKEDAVNLQKEDKLQIDASRSSQGIVVLSGYTGQEIRLFDVSGKTYPVAINKDDASVVVSFKERSSGIYLLCVGKETLKIQKK